MPSSEQAMSKVVEFHDAVRQGEVATVQALLRGKPALANCRSVTDARGTFPLHVAAQFGQAAVARTLVITAPTFRCWTPRTTQAP
jgi:hypothetical protein